MPMDPVNIQWKVLDAVLILSLLVELTEQPTGSHAADIWKWIRPEAEWAPAGGPFYFWDQMKPLMAADL